MRFRRVAVELGVGAKVLARRTVRELLSASTRRRLAERDHRSIVSRSEFDRDSHRATYDAPDLLIGDLRKLPEGSARVGAPRPRLHLQALGRR